jgi:glycosyltransferase involved in cell wall biosynthesis
MNPLVSVIVAAYNAEKYIGAAIKSILGQTYQHFELIIVDDASQDNTAEITKSFYDSRIKLIKHPHNAGPGKARNTAISASQGRYIAVLDADDLSMPTRLQAQVNFLESHPEVDVVGSNEYCFNSYGKIIGQLGKSHTEHHDLIRHIDRNLPFAHPTMMAKAGWLSHYRYRESYRRAQDRELFLRTYQHSKFANLPQNLYAYRLPNKVNIRNVTLSLYCNLLMRMRHWQEYGLPLRSVLLYPLTAGGKMLYYLISALLNRNIFWAHIKPLTWTEPAVQDQEWIYRCLGRIHKN